VSQFAFLKPAGESTALTYQRFDDADIVDAAAVVPLHLPLLQRPVWAWLAAMLVSLGSAIVGGTILCRRRRRVAAHAPRYRRPQRLTPFSLLVLLRRLHDDETLALSQEQLGALDKAIEDLQRQYFGRQPPSADGMDLATILDRWLAVAALLEQHHVDRQHGGHRQGAEGMLGRDVR
jgi:hypothetical protein